MPPRRRSRPRVLAPLCLAIAATLLGCQDDQPSADDADTTAAEEPTPTDGTAGTDESNPTAGEMPDEAAPGDDQVAASPSVPALHPAIDGLAEAVVTIATDQGQEVRVDVKVATAPEDRSRGLMEVEELPEGAGMLFVFDDERTGGFWMWDTLVPLDIAYLDADGRIVDILAMDPCEAGDPADCPTYAPDQPYVAALEVPQGWFAWQGVVPGAHVQWTRPEPPASERTGR